jgi:hypothetical protein
MKQPTLAHRANPSTVPRSSRRIDLSSMKVAIPVDLSAAAALPVAA